MEKRKFLNWNGVIVIDGLSGKVGEWGCLRIMSQSRKGGKERVDIQKKDHCPVLNLIPVNRWNFGIRMKKKIIKSFKIEKLKIIKYSDIIYEHPQWHFICFKV